MNLRDQAVCQKIRGSVKRTNPLLYDDNVPIDKVFAINRSKDGVVKHVNAYR